MPRQYEETSDTLCRPQWNKHYSTFNEAKAVQKQQQLWETQGESTTQQILKEPYAFPQRMLSLGCSIDTRPLLMKQDFVVMPG